MIKALVVSLLAVVLLGSTQPNTDLALKIADARKANATLMTQFSWTCRTELTEDQKVLDIRLESITYGPGGKLQRSLINDEGSPLPHGFLRRRIAEHKKEELEKYFTGLRELLDQYTLPTAGKILDFVNSTNIQVTNNPGGTAWLKLNGTGVVHSGDSLMLELDPTSKQTRRMQISTTYEGGAVTATASFKTSKTGLTYMNFAEVEVPDKNMTLQVHNFDYEQNN